MLSVWQTLFCLEIYAAAEVYTSPRIKRYLVFCSGFFKVIDLSDCL